MKKYTLNSYVVLAIILSFISFAQGWVAWYNGPGDSTDVANAIALDNSANVYVTGESVGSDTDYDYATIKYNASGDSQWVARYNGPGNDWDGARAIAVDNAGNVYVTGGSDGAGTYYDYATVKYDSSGVERWVTRYNGPGNWSDKAHAIAVDNAGNIYVTGESDSSGSYHDYATVKYDSSGVKQWVARYNGPGNSQDYARAIAIDNTGNIYVTGASGGAGTYYDYATVKYDSLGVEQWVARYNGPGNGRDYASVVALDNAGNIYVTGASESTGTYYDYATVKYDSLGVEQWVARYNGPGDTTDVANAIALDNSGNIYVTGGSYGSGTDCDYATVKYDYSGVAQWVARYNGPGNGDDAALAIALDNTGNVYVTGRSGGSGTHVDYVTIKYDSYGVEQWVIISNGLGNDYDEANAIALDDSANIYVTGKSMGLDTDFDYMTIKYSSTGVKEDVVTRVKNSYLDATIFRGPLLLPEGKKCKVFDIAGRVVEPTKITRGIYFIVVDGKITRKAIKIR